MKFLTCHCSGFGNLEISELMIHTAFKKSPLGSAFQMVKKSMRSASPAIPGFIRFIEEFHHGSAYQLLQH